MHGMQMLRRLVRVRVRVPLCPSEARRGPEWSGTVLQAGREDRS